MSSSDIKYTRVKSREEMEEILELQQKNLRKNLLQEEILSEGFVTVTHTIELLSKMNETCPHIIAKAGPKVVGYALCMHPAFRNEIEVLMSMFEKIDALLDPNVRYLAMGQICIDREYRGKGIFRGLYKYMKSELRLGYDLIITEVDDENIRSLNAHYAIGFEEMREYDSGNRTWHLIGWDLRNSADVS